MSGCVGLLLLVRALGCYYHERPVCRVRTLAAVATALLLPLLLLLLLLLLVLVPPPSSSSASSSHNLCYFFSYDSGCYYCGCYYYYYYYSYRYYCGNETLLLCPLTNIFATPCCRHSRSNPLPGPTWLRV